MLKVLDNVLPVYSLGQWNPKENVDWVVAHVQKLSDGHLAINVHFYGIF